MLKYDLQEDWRVPKLTEKTGYNQSVTGCGYQRRHVVVTQRKPI